MADDGGGLKKSLVDDATEALEQRRFADVIGMADTLLAADASDQQALLLKTGAQAELGDLEGAIATIELAVQLNDSNPWFQIIEAALLTRAGRDIDRAIELARSSIELDRDIGRAWEVLAGALSAQKRDDEAVLAAEKAVEIDPDQSSFLRTLGRLASVNDEPAKALNAFDRILDQDPNDVAALTLKVSALVSLDRLDEATEAAEKAYELDPTAPDVRRVQAGLLIIGREAFGEAESVLRGWAADEPDNSGAWSGLGLLFLARNEPEQALDALRRAVASDERDPLIRHWLGQAYLLIGQEEDALELFAELVSEDSRSEDNWLGKSVAERELGLISDAIDSARAALSIGSYKNAEVWVELARAYSAAAEYQNAWRAYSQAARTNPKDVDTAVGVAVSSLMSHNEARALSELIEAEERLGPHTLIEFNRGVAHFRLGREDRAVAAWRRASALDPDLSVAEILVSSFSSEARLGSWVDHWFRRGSKSSRSWLGAFLLVALILTLLVPILEPELIPGLVTGRLTLEAYIPALLLLLLLVLPTIRGLAVGGVSIDVAPLAAPEKPLKIDPDQILPMANREDLDVGRLFS